MNRIVYSILIVWFALVALSIQTAAQVNFTSSNLPIVFIETFGQEIPDAPRIAAHMSLVNNPQGRNHVEDDANDYIGKISIEIRGSTSQAFPKKQFGLETQWEDGSNRNVSLLGLPVENDWILAAPFSDKSLVRNVLAFELSRRLGHYAPRTRHCELVLNGEYMGVYVLTEKIKRDKSRVDIAKLDGQDVQGVELTGGYILKIDKLTGNSCGFWHTEIAEVMIQSEYPKCDDITDEQSQYIRAYLSDFEGALYHADFMHPTEGYRRYLDVPAAVDYFIINEISKNIDAYNRSTFFYKDREDSGGKIKFGPVWDYNLAFGNADYNGGYQTDSILAINVGWWPRLMSDSTFIEAISLRWKEVRNDEFCDERLVALVDSVAKTLAEAQERNFVRWPVLGTYIWPNYYIGETYQNELDYLKQWLFERIAWLDDEFLTEEPDCQTEFELSIFPNPFMNVLKCRLSLERAGNLSVGLYDLQGRLVDQPVDGEFHEKGNHFFQWNMSLESADLYDSFYILNIEVDGEVIARRKVLRASR